MRYLKNNGKPSKFTVNEQTKVGYVNKAGERKEIRIVMWRDPNIKAVENIEAQELMLSKTKKAILRYKIRPDGRREEEDDSRKDVGYSQVITNFPHILKYTCGTSFKDEREYNIMVGEIAEIENHDDAERVLKTFHFVDEVDQKGEVVEVICQSYGHKGEKVKGNPYRVLPSQRPDMTKAPVRYEEVGEEAAPRANPISKRVTEITRAGTPEEKKLLPED